jgi:hypothetical protein
MTPAAHGQREGIYTCLVLSINRSRLYIDEKAIDILLAKAITQQSTVAVVSVALL